MKTFIQPFYGLLLALFAIGLIFQSCENFVTVDLPESQLIGVTVFDDVSTADAAVTHIYSRLRDEVLVTGTAEGISCLFGTYADEIDYYSGGGSSAESFYQNNVLPTSPVVSTLWNNTYNLIYSTNALISGVSNSTAISASDRERLLGEAYFLRAYLHFYLVTIFGEVPYVISTDYEINRRISKMSIPDLYARMSTDLQQAVTFLPDDYFVSERTRPNKSVGYALLARVKLYSGDLNQAALYADMVISNSILYTIEPNIDAVFLNNSVSTLLQLAPQFSGSNTLEAQTFIFSSGPPPAFSLTDDLVNAFEVGDLRRSNWIGTVTDGISSWYYPNKYREQGTTGSSVEYSILFRLEEMYFIRAEYFAQLGDLNLGKAAVNVMRNRAGLANTSATTTSQLLTVIMEERRKEFFTELGHRWFDLKRSGAANTVLASSKPGWDLKDLLLPLPAGELTLNSNLLPQNAGY